MTNPPAASASASMEPNESHQTIKETVRGEPVLQEGETVLHKYSLGMPTSMFVLIVIVTFIPPFIWGVLVYIAMRFIKNSGGVWLTDRRVISFNGIPFTKSVRASYVPYVDIDSAKIDGPGSVTPFTDIIDRMTGTGDITIRTHTHKWPLVKTMGVKKPKDLINNINKMSSPKP